VVVKLTVQYEVEAEVYAILRVKDRAAYSASVYRS
jgi:hypothetical protein